MCLAVPGKIIEIRDEDPVLRMGTVDFGGVSKEINLSFVPEANTGDYVLVHAGFALNTIDEAEANKVFEYLREIEELGRHETDELGRSEADESGLRETDESGLRKTGEVGLSDADGPRPRKIDEPGGPEESGP